MQFDNFQPKHYNVDFLNKNLYYLSSSSVRDDINQSRVDRTTLLRVTEAKSWKRKIDISFSEENRFPWTVLAWFRAQFQLMVFSLGRRDAYYIISLYWENDVVIIYPASTISKFERWLLCLCSHFVPEYENDSLFIAINQSWIGKKFIQLSFSKSLIFTKLPLRVIVGLLQKTCYVPREVRFQPRSMLWLFNSQSVIPRTIERPESFMAPKNLNATKNGNFHKETLYN